MVNWLKSFFNFGTQGLKVVEQAHDADNKQHLQLVNEEIREDKIERELISFADDIIFNLKDEALSDHEKKLKRKYKKLRLDL